MRTTSANTKSSLSLEPVIAATKKLRRHYHRTYNQTHYVAKDVRRVLAIERPQWRTRVVARLSREAERQLIAHAYRVQGTRGLLVNMRFQTGARVSPHLLRHSVATTLLERGLPIEQMQTFLGHSKLETTPIDAESSAEMIKES